LKKLDEVRALLQATRTFFDMPFPNPATKPFRSVTHLDNQVVIEVEGGSITLHQDGTWTGVINVGK